MVLCQEMLLLPDREHGEHTTSLPTSVSPFFYISNSPPPPPPPPPPHHPALLQAKHMLMLKDVVVQDIIQFLEHCEGDG